MVWKTYLELNLIILLYSLSTVFSKLAAGEKMLSFRFCLYYGLVIVILGIYALGWQQIIKRLPLAAAYANKAVTVVWGIVWGILFFREKVTAGKLLGAAIVVAGVVIYAMSEKDRDSGEGRQ